MPLQFEPARQPRTASTTWPPVPGLTATSVANGFGSTPPDCEQPVGASAGVHAPEVVFAGCLYRPLLVAANAQPFTKMIFWTSAFWSSSPPTRVKFAPPSPDQSTPIPA